jgi:hypothetical protein
MGFDSLADIAELCLKLPSVNIVVSMDMAATKTRSSWF